VVCQWEMANFDPHRISTALKHRQKFVKADYVGDPYIYADT